MVANGEAQGSAVFRKATLWSTAKKTFAANASWIIFSRPNLGEEETGQGWKQVPPLEVQCPQA